MDRLTGRSTGPSIFETHLHVNTQSRGEDAGHVYVAGILAIELNPREAPEFPDHPMYPPPTLPRGVSYLPTSLFFSMPTCLHAYYIDTYVHTYLYYYYYYPGTPSGSRGHGRGRIKCHPPPNPSKQEQGAVTIAESEVTVKFPSYYLLTLIALEYVTSEQACTCIYKRLSARSKIYDWVWPWVPGCVCSNVSIGCVCVSVCLYGGQIGGQPNYMPRYSKIVPRYAIDIGRRTTLVVWEGLHASSRERE